MDRQRWRTILARHFRGGRAMASGRGHDDFVLQLIAAQGRLYAYILSLVLDRDRAAEVLQQTNLVLLEKERDYLPGSNFAAWAAKVAFYEVLADRRARQRDRHHFNDELLALIAQRADVALADHDARAEALDDCLKQLSEPHRKLLMERYRPGGSVAALAAAGNRTPAAISALLYRLRATLIECVERKLNISPFA